jgi:hypothetical protein
MVILSLLPVMLLALRRGGISSPPLSSSSSSLMDPILQHSAVAALTVDKKRARRKLTHRHEHLFETADTPFDELGRIVCRTGVVPRKEFLETYAAATVTHATFRQVRRVADVAAGHGLLSWFLLVLDEFDTNDSDDSDTVRNYPPRTAICIDRRMPPSATAIQIAMLERFPQLEQRWTYVQGDISAIEPHPSCLLTSVHACGTLSDRLVEMAIGDYSNSAGSEGSYPLNPLALVPCCHTIRVDKGYQPHVLSDIDAEGVAALVLEKKQSSDSIHEDDKITIANVVDEMRCRALEAAGFDVEEILLPEVFTARNRLLLADCQTQDVKRESPAPQSSQRRARSNRMPPLFTIPLKDDAESRAHCYSIGGKAEATARLVQQIPKHFSLSINLSIWLSDEYDTDYPDSTGISVKVRGKVTPVISGVKVHAATGRRSILFRVEYTAVLSERRSNLVGTSSGVSRVAAKNSHDELRNMVVNELGVELRG